MKSSGALITSLSLLMVLSAARIGLAQQPQFAVNDPIVLSDSHGYDFAPYLNSLTSQVREKWYQTIPEEARQGQKGRAVVLFTVLRDGTIQDVRIVSSSGTPSLDRASTRAVLSVSPSQLPTDFSDNRIVVQFAFLYNQ